MDQVIGLLAVAAMLGLMLLARSLSRAATRQEQEQQARSQRWLSERARSQRWRRALDPEEDPEEDDWPR